MRRWKQEQRNDDTETDCATDCYVSPLLPNRPYPSLTFKAEILEFGGGSHSVFTRKQCLFLPINAVWLVGLITHAQINFPLLLQAHTQEFLHSPDVANIYNPLLPQLCRPHPEKHGGPPQSIEDVGSVYIRLFINKPSHMASAMVYSSGKLGHQLQCPSLV